MQEEEEEAGVGTTWKEEGVLEAETTTAAEEMAMMPMITPDQEAMAIVNNHIKTELIPTPTSFLETVISHPIEDQTMTAKSPLKGL